MYKYGYKNNYLVNHYNNKCRGKTTAYVLYYSELRENQILKKRDSYKYKI